MASTAPANPQESIRISPIVGHGLEAARRICADLDELRSPLCASGGFGEGTAVNSQFFYCNRRLVRGLESYADRAFRRALFFANEAASQALSSMHTEFKPIPETIVAGNSIVQISLWSKTSERTFFDFRILVSAFTRRPGIRCAVLPSTSFVLKFSTPRAYCFRVEFGTFSDICQALDVAANSRG